MVAVSAASPRRMFDAGHRGAGVQTERRRELPAALLFYVCRNFDAKTGDPREMKNPGFCDESRDKKKKKNGGVDRSRTGLNDFADRCLTDWLPRPV